MSVSNSKRRQSQFGNRLISFRDLSKTFSTLWEKLRIYSATSWQGDEYILDSENEIYNVSENDSYIYIRTTSNVVLTDAKDRQILVLVGAPGEYTSTINLEAGVLLDNKSSDGSISASETLTLRYYKEDKNWAILSFR